MHKLFADAAQLAQLKDMLNRTTRGIEQTRANIKRMESRTHEQGSQLELRRRDGIARLTDIVEYQQRVITTLTAILKDV
jgi:hypothetical protein